MKLKNKKIIDEAQVELLVRYLENTPDEVVKTAFVRFLDLPATPSVRPTSRKNFVVTSDQLKDARRALKWSNWSLTGVFEDPPEEDDRVIEWAEAQANEKMSSQGKKLGESQGDDWTTGAPPAVCNGLAHRVWKHVGCSVTEAFDHVLKARRAAISETRYIYTSSGHIHAPDATRRKLPIGENKELPKNVMRALGNALGLPFKA